MKAVIQGKKKGMLLAIMSAVCYGMSPLLVELFFANGGTTYSYTLIKNIFVMLLTLSVIAVRGQSVKLPGRTSLKLMVAGVMACGMVTVTLATSYIYLGGGVATTLHFMYPLFTALIFSVFFKRKMPVYKWILLAVVSCSIMLFVDFGDSSTSLIGILMAIVSGVFFALFIVLSDTWRLGEVDSMHMLLYMAIGGMLVAVPAMIISGEPLFAFSAKGLAFACGSAFIDVVIGNMLFVKSMNYIDGTETAFFSVMEPVTSAILNSVFLAELLTVKSVIGIVIILGSMTFMTYLDNRKEKAGTS